MFLNKRYQEIFSQHGLGNFDQLWANKMDWFEEPNIKRGELSGVGRVVLETENEDLTVFIKKQKNYIRKTLWHPKAGEPTFRREFERLQYLQEKQVNAAKVVFYDEQHEGSDKAILITEALIGYEPLDALLESGFAERELSFNQRRQLIKKVAEALRGFHAAGLQHRALYPKHIFVKNAETTPEVALIDLEKSRFGLFLLRRAYYDLAQLNRHAPHLSNTERLYFILQYLDVPKLSWRAKQFCRLLLKRSRRK